MKRSLLIALCFVFCAGMAFAQAGSIGVFSDVGGTDCNLSDVAPVLCSYYVVHTNHAGATQVKFMAPAPPCLLASWLIDDPVFPDRMGTSQTGIVIGYGGPCYPSPTHVLTMNYYCQALTPQCCEYRVLPHPAAPSGQIEVWDCAYNILFATGSCAVVNPNFTAISCAFSV